VRDVTDWPERIRAVTAAEILDVAKRYLQPGRFVVGHLLKAAA
jgi:predicted Zn-dependent peptidase